MTAIYGYLYNSDSSPSLTISDTSTHQLTFANSGPSNNTTYSSNSIVVSVSGVVKATATVIVNQDVSNNPIDSEYYLEITQNGTTIINATEYGMVNPGYQIDEYGQAVIALDTIITCNSGDTFAINFADLGNRSAAATYNFTYSSFAIHSVNDLQGAPASGDLGGTYPNPEVVSISSSSVVATSANKLAILQGQNVEVSSLKISNYTVQATDFIIGIGTLTNTITITMPASPNIGDIYIIKDVNGTAGNPYAVLINGNGNSIDGFGTNGYMLNVIYQSATLVFTGTIWSII